MADKTDATQNQRLWALSYLDPQSAIALARELASSDGPDVAIAWWHLALTELRVGDAALAQRALDRARELHTSEPESAGRRKRLALCDELQAMSLRRAGHLTASAELQAEIDARDNFTRDAEFRFLAHNSRSLTHKLISNHDEGLRHAYLCSVAANESGHPGLRILALANLGDYHRALFNLDDARKVSEEALQLAREHHVQQAIGVAATNLISTYHAAGEGQAARAMVDFLTDEAAGLGADRLVQYSLSLAMGHLSVGEIEAAMGHLQKGAQSVIGEGDGLATWAWLTARCLLARGDAAAAREVLQDTAQLRESTRVTDLPYDQMELFRVQAEANEQLGDLAAAIACLRKAHAIYEDLVGRSARARFITLEVSHQLLQAKRERDSAIELRGFAEDERLRLARLNVALQTKISEVQELHAQLSEQALRDPLTGLHNRRYLFEVTPGLLELARRQNKPLCVVLLDLDHFKRLNDTFGHAAGDEVLVRFANMLLTTLRRSDVVNRHGGEEFVAVMPDTDAAGARARMEQLLAALQTTSPDDEARRRPRVSFSAGVAEFPRHGATLDQLLLCADRALYRAKDMGRGRVEQAVSTSLGALV